MKIDNVTRHEVSQVRCVGDSVKPDARIRLRAQNCSKDVQILWAWSCSSVLFCLTKSCLDASLLIAPIYYMYFQKGYSSQLGCIEINFVLRKTG